MNGHPTLPPRAPVIPITCSHPFEPPGSEISALAFRLGERHLVTSPSVLVHRDASVLRLSLPNHEGSVGLPPRCKILVDDGSGPGIVEIDFGLVHHPLADLPIMCSAKELDVAQVGDIVYILVEDDSVVVIGNVIARDWIERGYEYVLDIPRRPSLFGGPVFRNRSLIGVVGPSLIGTRVIGVDSFSPVRQRAAASRRFASRQLRNELTSLPLYSDVPALGVHKEWFFL